ncbi:hypothetical protein PybrP1_009407 [[Pythium] brassicae (nom. inval.)]|nr:hypothetical protein PybrP1_009407 [[Pythium] brassicae (nom. inval.)]
MEVGIGSNTLPTAPFGPVTSSPATAMGGTSSGSGPGSGSVAIARRSDGGVSLGLFSKIAAARKEKLAPVRDDSRGASSRRLLAATADLSANAVEKRASAAAALPSQTTGGGGASSHFPEIHDASSRAAVARAPPNPRKVTARTFAQNLRWTKHGFGADDSSAKTGLAAAPRESSGTPPRRSTAISPVVRTVQPDRVQPHQMQRLSVFELVYFAETAEIPGVPIVYRNQKAKATNPERLNLDRRNLPVIPLLEGEHMLRLINLQNNSIRRIENLLGLPNLIFLDLYNNRVEKLENFAVVPNLRVLMLGKNRLRTIENLECLKKLDVLDLHSNGIEVMQNLNELRELRVLNLGGNRVSTLENIDKLALLTELNLRRNQIERIGAIGKLPSLQRLFLSNNRIETLEALDTLLPITSISELRLDGNAVSESGQSEYRAKMIRSFPALKHLDLKPLSDVERKEAMAIYTQTKSAAKERDEIEEAHRAHAIACAKTLWERREKLAISTPGRPLHDASVPSLWGSTSSSSSKALKASSTAVASREEREFNPTSREDAAVHNNQTGLSEVEVRGDYRVLVIYGDALEALESAKVHALVNAISFRYVHIDKVVAAATAATSSNLKLFGRLRRLNFAHNDLRSFDQLLWLSLLGTKAEELFISSNPICAKALLKRFLGARISNTLRLNGEEISASDRLLGKQLFPKAARQKPPLDFASVEPLSLPPKARDAAPGAAKSTVSLLASEIFSTASEMEQKAAETLQDIERRDSFMSRCLEGL